MRLGAERIVFGHLMLSGGIQMVVVVRNTVTYMFVTAGWIGSISSLFFVLAEVFQRWGHMLNAQGSSSAISEDGGHYLVLLQSAPSHDLEVLLLVGCFDQFCGVL